MAREKKADSSEPLTSEGRIARLLALVAIKEIEDKSDQVIFLLRAGFGPAETAEMLGVTSNYVSVVTYKKRQGPKRKRKGKPKPKRKQ